MVTQTLEAMVTLPGGEKVDVSHFIEYDGYYFQSFGESYLIGRGYLQAREREPLFVTTMEAYFAEKLGSEWANIIRMEDQLNQQIMERKNSRLNYPDDIKTVVDYMAYWTQFDRNYKLGFVRKEEGCYIFQLIGMMLGRDDPEVFDVMAKVKPTISVEGYESV